MKKIMSLLVSVAMLLSILPTVVLADEVETSGIYEIINSGIESSSDYIQTQIESANNADGVTYGYEWYIIAMLRAGKTIDENILDEYYASVTEEVKNWDAEVKPTDAERTALALLVLDKDITDVDRVNSAELIYNNPRIEDGSNEAAYALITLDASKIEIPDDAMWTRETLIDVLLSFQAENGGFGLTDNETPEIDITAICLQALAPYQANEIVKEATDKAIAFLKENISEDFTFNDNANSTAQVLMAAASLKIDVTNPENGFGDAENNLVTAIEKYRNPDGNGYMYGDMVSSMATFQVMQAYDAYKKAFKENIPYWDFSAKIENDDDNEENEGDLPDPEVESAQPANVYVTIVSDGSIVKGRNDMYVAQAPVTVTDIDCNGVLTVDEALYATHEAYYDGGAEAGYNTFTGVYGLSLGVLWGKGTPGTSAAAGYWLNNASCWSLNDAVTEGDYLTAFNYYDATYWSDSYAFFDKNEAEGRSGSSVKLTLYAMGYDESWNTVSSPYGGAKVRFLGAESDTEFVTDEDGKVKISLKNVDPGSYYVAAYAENNSIVPTVCKINVTKKASSSGGSSGGGGSGKVEVKKEKEETEIETEVEVKPETEVEELPESTINVFAEDTFSDVKSDSWYYNSVKYVYENNLMNGTENGFEPESEMTRAMLVTVLYRMADAEEKEYSHSFADVSSDKWYADAVAWAAANGIVTGVSETEFAPDSNITREQMAVIIYRFAKIQGYNVEEKADISAFSDSDKVSDWAFDAFGWANKAGIINGLSESTLSPESTSTRAQVATILMRFCESEAGK